MKKILIVLASIFLFSCASAPEKPVEEETVIEEVQKPISITEIRNKAYSAMEKALSIKANVAVKADYKSAEKMFNDAEALDASDPEEAAEAALIYLDAETAFNAVYDSAYAKRENALKELDMARGDIKAAEDEADMAEKEAAGGTE